MDSGGLLEGTKSLARPNPSSSVSSAELLNAYYAVHARQVSLWEYWRILVKRRWLIACVALGVLLIGTILTLRMTRLYEASARIAIFKESQDSIGIKDTDPYAYDDYDYSLAIDTQIAILKSDAIALAVVRDLHLDANPAFAGAQPRSATVSPVSTLPFDAARETALIGAFKGGLRASPVQHTRLIDLYYSSPDPRLAAEIVNSICRIYVEQNFKTKYESTMQTSEWLTKQLADLQAKVQLSQEKLVAYQKEHGILGVDEKQNIITSKLDELNRELTNAQAERIQKEANDRTAASGDPEQIATVTQSGILTSLRTREAELRTQYAQATTQFGPSYPKVLELKSQLDEVEGAIAGEVHKIGQKIHGEYQAATYRERMLHAALESQKQEANQLNENAIEYNLLRRDVETNRQLYEGLLQRLKEAGISAGLRSSNIRVVDTARVPTVPSHPDVPRNLMLSLLMGLAGGVTLAFVMESLDDTVRTPDEVQAISSLPALGTIPLSLSLAQHKKPHGKARQLAPGAPRPLVHRQPVEMITHFRPKSEVAESYRALRTSILLSSLQAPPKVILVSSALPQEGKTTTALNTAIVLAQRGARVLLVDADLRRPSIHAKLGLSAKAGLTTLLTGSHQPSQVVVPYLPLPQLFVLPAGPTPPHPAELLGSALMSSYLKQWRQEFDHIVIDTPPTLSVTDPVLLSVEADSVILVIRSGQTTKEALRRSRDLLLQVNARIMGVVVNAMDARSPGYNYYYGSKYAWRYYEEGHRA